MKIHKIQGDISKEVANSFKESVAIDTEATGLKIPERDKLSLIQICGQNSDVYIIQPDKKSYQAPNLISVLENKDIIKDLESNIKNIDFVATTIIRDYSANYLIELNETLKIKSTNTKLNLLLKLSG